MPQLRPCDSADRSGARRRWTVAGAALHRLQCRVTQDAERGRPALLRRRVGLLTGRMLRVLHLEPPCSSAERGGTVGKLPEHNPLCNHNTYIARSFIFDTGLLFWYCSAVFHSQHARWILPPDAGRTVSHRDPAARSRRSPAPAGAGALVARARQRRLAPRHQRPVSARAGRPLADRLRLAGAGACDEPAAAVSHADRGHADPLRPPARPWAGADAAAARTRLAVDVLGLPEGHRAAR